MPTMLIPTCPLCGLRYASRPLWNCTSARTTARAAARNQGASTLAAPGRPPRRLAAHPAELAWPPGRPAPRRR
jgi:hypothetical protein